MKSARNKARRKRLQRRTDHLAHKTFLKIKKKNHPNGFISRHETELPPTVVERLSPGSSPTAQDLLRLSRTNAQKPLSFASSMTPSQDSSDDEESMNDSDGEFSSFMEYTGHTRHELFGKNACIQRPYVRYMKLLDMPKQHHLLAPMRVINGHYYSNPQYEILYQRWAPCVTVDILKFEFWNVRSKFKSLLFAAAAKTIDDMPLACVEQMTLTPLELNVDINE